MFLIEWSKADSLLKEKRIWGCEMQEFISLPIKLWNGISRCFLSINCSNKMSSLRKLKFFCRKILTLLSCPLPLGKFKQGFLASCWEDFCQFYFLPEGRKTNWCMLSNSQQSWEEEEKANCPGCVPATQRGHLCPLGWAGQSGAGVLQGCSPKPTQNASASLNEC